MSEYVRFHAFSIAPWPRTFLYARVSTIGQTTENQVAEVKAAGFAVQSSRIITEDFQVYGVRKVWRQLDREGIRIARCTTARLMAERGLAGMIRGKPVKTRISNPVAPSPRDHLNRQFHAACRATISMRSLGDSYNNVLAETINGLFKTEVIQRRGPGSNAEAVAIIA